MQVSCRGSEARDASVPCQTAVPDDAQRPTRQRYLFINSAHWSISMRRLASAESWGLPERGSPNPSGRGKALATGSLESSPDVCCDPPVSIHSTALQSEIIGRDKRSACAIRCERGNWLKQWGYEITYMRRQCFKLDSQ
jgi:hypothetical protein